MVLAEIEGCGNLERGILASQMNSWAANHGGIAHVKDDDGCSW